MSEWNVLVKRYDTGEVVKTISCDSERKAAKVQMGLDINLNHEEYYTTIEEAV